jgi:hypothetical protein
LTNQRKRTNTKDKDLTKGQETSAERAKLAFDRGVELVSAGKLDDALKAFDDSLFLDSNNRSEEHTSELQSRIRY